MLYDPDKHHRRSIRLPGYDYAACGAYFVTITLQRRAHLLGYLADGRMHCSDAGAMIWRWWRKLPEKFPSVAIDAFVVMPDHIHGIIILGAGPGEEGAKHFNESARHLSEGAHMGAPVHDAADAGNADDDVAGRPACRPAAECSARPRRQR
jgi:hypothetical protein